MRYINKEYGFTFRPPFLDKFHEESADGPALSEKNFPARYIQGAGYDYSAINGAMLVGIKGSLWGVRVSCYDGKKWLDNDDFASDMAPSCANTADGSFAHFSSGPVSVKWIKHTEQSLIMQVSARKKLKVRIIFYPCYGWGGELSIEDSTVKGRCAKMGILPGTVGISDVCGVFKDRFLAICDDDPEREFFYAKSFSHPLDSAHGAFNEAIMEFVINKNQPSVYLYAAVGDETIFDAEIPRLDRVINQIESAELRYGVNKTRGTGALGAAAERMFNSVLWSRIYYPYLLTEIYSPQRARLNRHFDIKGTEENCSAILGSYAGLETAVSQLKFTVEDKILAAIACWHAFSHSSDKSDVLHLYKSLSKQYPPVAELVVSGADLTEVAYKWNDSPLKEKKNAPMYSLDMSCLKLLAFDVLERICAMYALPLKRKYEKAKNEMIQLINDTFWNEYEGLYMNKGVTGQWAFSYGATSFYPLIAGAVDTNEKLSALINNLTDPKKFWVKNLVPTLSANNREYGNAGKPNNNGERKPPYLEYRGSIVPYVNYIIYQGLCRYGLDELAGQVALSSAKLWANNQSDNVENFSLYLPTGKMYKSKEYLSSNGNILALMGIQELIDIEYFRPDLKTNALRFGTFVSGEHSLTNLKLFGRSYSIDLSDDSTMLVIDDVDVFRGVGGKFVVRNFLETKTGCEFLIDAHANITVNLNISFNKQTTKYFFIVPVGKSRVIAEGGMVNIQPI